MFAVMKSIEMKSTLINSSPGVTSRFHWRPLVHLNKLNRHGEIKSTVMKETITYFPVNRLSPPGASAKWDGNKLNDTKISSNEIYRSKVK